MRVKHETLEWNILQAQCDNNTDDERNVFWGRWNILLILVIQTIISVIARILYTELQNTPLQMNQQEKCDYSLIQIEYVSVSFVFG